MRLCHFVLLEDDESEVRLELSWAGGSTIPGRAAVRYHARPSSIPIRLGISQVTAFPSASGTEWRMTPTGPGVECPGQPERCHIDSSRIPISRFASCLLPAAPWRARAAGSLPDLSSTIHTEGTWSRTRG
jgi:hypothetical protein